jgi:hypothetical protein
MQKSLTKKLGMTVAAIAMAATGLFTATDAEAVPAFARQTGMTCNSCHFQSYPVLNGMGRSFKSGGYTMQGTQPMIEGEGLSLPSTLNMSVIWKFFVNSNADGGQIVAAQDEVSFLVGGRVNQSTGFLWEVTGDAFASQKIHFNVTDEFAVIPFITDAAGPAYGFDILNTGLSRPIRPIENRAAIIGSKRMTDAWDSAATGIALVYHTPDFFVNYTMYSASMSSNGDSSAADKADLTKMAGFVRAGFFFDLAGFDSAVGVATRTGSYTNADAVQNDVGGTWVDFQMQGEVGGKPLGFYFVNASGADSAADTSTGITVKYTAMDHFEVFVASASGKGGGVDKSDMSVGFEYLTSLNTKIMVASNSTQDASTTQIGFETAM